MVLGNQPEPLLEGVHAVPHSARVCGVWLYHRKRHQQDTDTDRDPPPMGEPMGATVQHRDLCLAQPHKAMLANWLQKKNALHE